LCIGCGDQSARHLDLRARGLVVLDEAGRTVAFDLLELIAIDRDIAARARLARPARKRPQHGPNGRRRHQCKSEPQRHINPSD
jgi:hypothetical protein